MRIQKELRDWINEMSRGGHDVDAILTMMEDAGYGSRQSRQILAKVLNRPALALDIEMAGSAPVPAQAPGGDVKNLRTTPPEAPGVDVDGRHIAVSTSMERPVIRVLHNVLDDEECDALIEMARPRMQRALTVANSGQQQVDQARTSDGMFFEVDENPLIRTIEKRLSKLVNLPLSHGEALQMLHYHPGQEYKPHQDWFDPRQPAWKAVAEYGGQRIASIIIYLNTPEAGGGTHFPYAGLTVAAQRGDAVYFAYETGEKYSLHAGLPVERGEKWIATRWLREQPYRKPRET